MSLKKNFAILFLFLFGFVGLLHSEPVVTNTPIGTNRAEMHPFVEASPNGAKITAKFHMAQLGSPVSLSILAPVMDPKTGDKRLIEIVKVDDHFKHSATDYNTERTYELNYKDINAMLKDKAPQANLEIGPGTNLYVFARWMNQKHLDMYDQPIPGIPTPPYNSNAQNNHQWGGIQREGLIVLPGVNPNAAPLVTTGFTKGFMTSGLDVSNLADKETAKRNPGIYANSSSAGSRFENELKLHLDLNDIPRVAKYFNDLEQNPALVEQIYGKGWKLVANRKYVGKPMIDDYMDNVKSEAAEKGMALRLRTGNNITSLNYKPNDGKYVDGAIYERIEYDLRNFPDVFADSTWNATSVQAMKNFVDGNDQFNPLQLIRLNIAGSIPSQFFNKTVRLTDERLKFELTAPTGDQVEISVDNVKARKIQKVFDPKNKVYNYDEYGPTVQYGQLEVEVNHLGATGSTSNYKYLSESNTSNGAEMDKWLKTLGPNAKIASYIPPSFHGEDDFRADSPIKTANAANFKLAFDVFDKIRTGVFGNNWHSSGQKYAVAAAGLGLVTPDRFAPSVNRMLEEKSGKKNLTSTEKLSCLNSLLKLSGS